MAESKTCCIRCVNIDWLEVYCNEGGVRKDAAYFIDKGYKVVERQYGTPQYSQMFTLWENGFPLIEIRREPYSLRTSGGIFYPGDCHLRLSNRQCYSESPIDFLRKFLVAFSYTYKSISRIDICLDFTRFDNGEEPTEFIKRFMKGEVSKLNQCKVAAHGTDNWAGRVWNSIKWGAPTSPISTKLYNKSLEMKQQHRKFYIEDSWKAAGLDTSHDVWRVEFSVKSHIHGFVRLETGEIIESKLTTYDSRNKCLLAYHMLQSRYFDFRLVQRTRSGLLIRKNRCKKLNLFVVGDGKPYKAIHLTKQHEPTRTDRMLIKRLHSIVADNSYSEKDRLSAQYLIGVLVERMRAQPSEILIMKQEVLQPVMTDRQFQEYISRIERLYRNTSINNSDLPF